MKLGKKGFFSEKIGFWIIYIIALGFTAIFLFIFLSRVGSGQSTIYGDVGQFNLIERFLNSPECFSYQENGITYAKIIDWNKFEQGRLDSCYDSGKSQIEAFRLTLKLKNSNLQKPAIQTANWNEKKPYNEQQIHDVIIYAENKKQNGEMAIDIQAP